MHEDPAENRAAARQRHPPPDIVVPLQSLAVPNSDKGDNGTQNQRDRHIRLVEPRGSLDFAAAVLNTMIRTAKPVSVRVT